MTLSNEDLLAISQLLDIKLKSELQPLKDDIRYIQLHLENETDKRIQLLAENMKKVITEHSEKLQKLA